jgi:hypothetical protein
LAFPAVLASWPTQPDLPSLADLADPAYLTAKTEKAAAPIPAGIGAAAFSFGRFSNLAALAALPA